MHIQASSRKDTADQNVGIRLCTQAATVSLQYRNQIWKAALSYLMYRHKNTQKEKKEDSK